MAKVEPPVAGDEAAAVVGELERLPHVRPPLGPRLSPIGERRLDRKLASIAAGRYGPDDFVIADAKDADMAWGVAAAGPRPGVTATGPHPGSTATGPHPVTATAGPGVFRTRADYLDAMRQMIAQGVVDIVLASASNAERLASDGSLDDDDVTLAVRANDTTDIWNPRGGRYAVEPSRPFRSVRLAAVRPFCDLVLYSLTFNNDLARDRETLEGFRVFRQEAADVGIRYFLEVFNPNAASAPAGADVGAFVNDCVVRTLAGVTSAERPLFLKVAYNGGNALAELVEHDPSLVVGILGGSAGTTRDTFELLYRAQLHGARVALFGRRIQRAESQLDLVALMRPVLRAELTPSDAVHAYHDALGKAEIAPIRSLQDDLEVTDPVLQAE